MKKLIYFAVIILISFACKKDDDSFKEQLTPKIDTETITYHAYDGTTAFLTKQYTYNPEGLISSLTTSYPQINRSIISDYSYLNDSLIRIVTYESLVENDTTFLELNSAGLVIKEIFKSHYGTSSDYTGIYEYDDLGYISYQKTTFPNPPHGLLNMYSNSYTIENGNITVNYSNIQHNNDLQIFRYEYTFINDRKNTLGNANRGTEFYGLSNTNPISKKSVIGGSLYYYTYAYEYDNLNRIKKEIESCSDTIYETTTSKTYTYQ